MTQRHLELRESCPICQTPAAEARRESPEFLRCPGCDLRYRTRVMVSDLRESWESDYYGNPRILEHHAKRVSAFHDIERVLSGFAPQRGRLLDIGCGIGVFLDIAQKAGWEVVGIEASATAAALARQRVRGPIVHGDILGFEERESFDAVTCLDVLRTVVRPLEVLEQAFAALRPGGMVMVRETHGRWRSGARVRARRQSLAHQYAQQWPPRTLMLTLAKAGFVDSIILPSPVFLEGRESWPRLQLKRILFVLSMAVYAVSRRVITPNVLAVARRPPVDDD